MLQELLGELRLGLTTSVRGFVWEVFDSFFRELVEHVQLSEICPLPLTGL